MKKIRIKGLIICAAIAVGTLFSGCSNGSANVSGGNVDSVTLSKGDLVAEIEIKDFGTIKAKLFPEAAPLGVENFQKLSESGFYKNKTIHRVMENFMFQGGSLNGNGTGGDALVNGGTFGVESADNLRHFYGALCYANAEGQNTTQFYIVNNKKEGAFDADIEYYKKQMSLCDERIKIYQSENTPEGVEYFTRVKNSFNKYINDYKMFPANVKELYNQNGGVPQLDGKYTVFGQVVEGFDVIDAVSAVEVTENIAGEKSSPVKEIIITDIRVSTVE